MEGNPNPSVPITDYNQTQRIVLLIDLNPLLHLQNPSPYINSVLCSIKTLISFPPLSSSLFAYKLFFSSLSPLLSSSKLNSALSLYFNLPNPTFNSLSKTLNSLPSFFCNDPPPSDSSYPKASCLAASIRQLLHDYAWDPPVLGTLFNNFDSVFLRSNLVILLSPFCGLSSESLSQFVSVEVGDDCLESLNLFCERFRRFFANLNETFVSRDIQISWVDVRYEIEGCEGKVEMRNGFFETGIRSLGWGCSSTDSIVLGSALVPFGLIYPKIVISPSTYCCDESLKKVNAQLSLKILDVAQKPLECKCCDLELVDMKIQPRIRSDSDILYAVEDIEMGSQIKKVKFKKQWWEHFDDSTQKFQVKALWRNTEFEKFKWHLSDPILVRELSGKPGKDQKEVSGNFFAYKVLEMLAMDLGEFLRRKSIPIWQILLSFLYREGYWALVSLANEGSVSCTGILKPFTISSALLFVIDDGFFSNKIMHEFDIANMSQYARQKTDGIDMNHLQGSQDVIKHFSDGDRLKRTSKRNSGLFQDLTWSAFCKAAFEHSELKLEDVNFDSGFKNSKKLKFLKCWMKQMKRSGCSDIILEEESKTKQEILKEIDHRLTDLHEKSEQPISSCASGGGNCLLEASGVQDEEAACEFQVETSEAFLSDLSNKIQQGIESEGVDLADFAQRLVNSSIYWLNKRLHTETTIESQKHSQEAGFLATAELVKLLLRDPKDLIAKHKSNDPSLQASDSKSPKSTSDKAVREYELQILFRMEILRSEVAENIDGSLKQKFVKQICSLLETIQCHLEGGFFCDWSLESYVDKILKARYSETLGDVVHKIYSRMDLLLFATDDEPPSQVLASEDSNPSWRGNPERDEFIDDHGKSEPVSIEDESHQPLEDVYRSTPRITQEEHSRKLIEAQERRERSRRFTSFTSWVPNLQRVWAPKQPKAMKSELDPLRKMSKRKNCERPSNDTVCETPMTEKRSCSQCSNTDEEEQEDYYCGSQSSVSKKLFQDDDW